MLKVAQGGFRGIIKLMKNDNRRQHLNPDGSVPNAKKFTSEYQPSPEAKSKGIQERNARLRMRALIESTLDEMLQNPNVRADDVKAIIEGFNKDSTVMDIVFNRYMRALSNPSTPDKTIKELGESLVKLGYGDKLDVTSNDETVNVAMVKFIDDGKSD